MLRSHAFAVAPLLAALTLLTASPVRSQTVLGTPAASGDQLLFFYDATASKAPFLVVSNFGQDALTLEVAWYAQDASQRLATQLEVLVGGGNKVFDPSQVAGVNGNAGLVVVTPVRSAADPTPIVPPSPSNDPTGPLFGGYTLADLASNSAFGQNPLARLAVDASGNRASAGAVVDGTAVRYQRFAPDALALPFYFDPTSAGLTNRVILAVFRDSYGASGFSIAPATIDFNYQFLDAAGSVVAQSGVGVSGVFFDDVQGLAGVGALTSSGKAVFRNAVDGVPDGVNTFGIVSQALGTFAVGQNMPGVFTQPRLVLDQQNLSDAELAGQGIGRFNDNNGDPDPSGASFDFQDTQTFIVGVSGLLARIRVPIINDQGGSLSVALDIRRAEAAPEGDDRQVQGTVYAPVSALVGVDVANPETWVTFDLRPLGLEVTDGQTLAFSVRTRARSPTATIRSWVTRTRTERASGVTVRSRRRGRRFRTRTFSSRRSSACPERMGGAARRRR